MTNHQRRKLNSFDSRWLAETVRLHQEESHQDISVWLTPIDGHGDVENDPVPANAEGSERLILLRARRLAEASGSLDALDGWRRQLGITFLIFSLLALAGGFTTALSVLGDSNQTVNVVWAITSLLGLHVLMLILWAVNMLLFRQSSGGGLGRLWLWVADRLATRKAHKPVISSFLALSWKADLSRWYLSAVTHVLWLLLLAGAAIGLIFTLSLRSYVFVWETTILPFEAFVTLVDALAWLPSTLGFPAPDADMVRMSGLAGNEVSPLTATDDYRRAWSSWLLGCLLVYGILPRLILAGACLLKLRSAMNAVRLDLSSRAWAALAAQLSPASSRLGITDPVSAAAAVNYFSAHANADAAPVLLALELDPARVSLPQVTAPVRTIAPVDNREQRRNALAELLAEPPARLLIVCDAGVSPDRGNLAWMAEISGQAAQTAVWLAGDHDKSGRLGAWRDLLLAMGLPGDRLFKKQGDALVWLKGGPP